MILLFDFKGENKMNRKEKFEKYVEIAKRAEKMGLLAFDRMSLIMDLQHTDDEFNLRLDDLLNADDFNFAHDIVGIQRNFNRESKVMDNLFVPRFSS